MITVEPGKYYVDAFGETHGPMWRMCADEPNVYMYRVADSTGVRADTWDEHGWPMSTATPPLVRDVTWGVGAAVIGAPEGVKHDEGKVPLHLLPPDALQAVAEILQFGAKKYGERNWEKGMAWSRVYRAALGHLFDWWLGRGPDVETGKSHLWHAACCVLFLVTFELRDVGTDDRPRNSR